jgi:cysteine synthase
MAQVADRTVKAERDALAETRRRIGYTLDAIEERVRPAAAGVSQGLANLRQVRGQLEVIGAAAATAGHLRGVIRTVRSLSRGRRVVIAGAAAGFLGALVWASRARASGRR